MRRARLWRGSVQSSRELPGRTWCLAESLGSKAFAAEVIVPHSLKSCKCALSVIHTVHRSRAPKLAPCQGVTPVVQFSLIGVPSPPLGTRARHCASEKLRR